MSLETGSFIKDLVATNPEGTDPKSQGDDHLRLLKQVLKTQFSGLTGGIAITKTEAQINNLQEKGLDVLVGPSTGYRSVAVERLDQGAPGDIDRTVMDSQTGNGSARFIHVNNNNLFAHGILIPRDPGTPPSWWNGSTYELFNGEFGGKVLRDTGIIGYSGGGTGSGGSVTQTGNRSSPVTLNKPNGRITTTAESLAAGAAVTFVVNNNKQVASTYSVLVNLVSGSIFSVEVVSKSSGSFTLRCTNTSGAATTAAAVIDFMIFSGSIS